MRDEEFNPGPLTYDEKLDRDHDRIMRWIDRIVMAGATLAVAAILWLNFR